jgi:lysophospholipid acyltransferase (LPLAT)-like uncharacterized protein
MKRSLLLLIYRYLIPYGGLLLVKALAATYRIRIYNREIEQAVLDRHQSVIYASWHQRFFPGITFFSSRKPIAIMISQSRDGEMIARVVDILGWCPVRGSSTRGGVAALKQLKALALKGYNIGHIVDGPKGPFGNVKPGLLRIAQVAGKPIVPTITSAQNKWVFNSWDRFMIPKPFSRLIIRFGDPIDVPARLEPEAFEQKRLAIEHGMEQLYADTDRIWDDAGRMAAVFPKEAGPRLGAPDDRQGSG